MSCGNKSIRENELREAKAICDKAIAEKLDGSDMHWLMYKIAFIESDAAAMQQQLEWAKSKGEGTRVPFFQALAAAYWGKLHESRTLFSQVIEGERAVHDEEGASSVTMQQARIDAQFGLLRRAKDQAVATAGAIPQSDKDLAAVTLALVGEADRAQAVINELEKRFSQDTRLNNVLAPSVRAAIEMNRSLTNWGKMRVCCLSTSGGKRTCECELEKKRLRSSRRSLTTGESLRFLPFMRWRIFNSLVLTLSKATPRKPAPPIKTFLPSGKTPIPTSPS